MIDTPWIPPFCSRGSSASLCCTEKLRSTSFLIELRNPSPAPLSPFPFAAPGFIAAARRLVTDGQRSRIPPFASCTISLLSCFFSYYAGQLDSRRSVRDPLTFVPVFFWPRKLLPAFLTNPFSLFPRKDGHFHCRIFPTA